MNAWYTTCLIATILTCTVILSYTIATAVDYIAKHIGKAK